jgi:hypothetical protein
MRSVTSERMNNRFAKGPSSTCAPSASVAKLRTVDIVPLLHFVEPPIASLLVA